MRLVDLCPYGVYPPISGGHRVVHHTSLCLGARHEVFVFAMGLRRFDGLRLRSFIHTPGGRYVEYRHITPLTFLSYVRRRRSGLPPLRASFELMLTAPGMVRERLGAADIVQVEHPWQFSFARASTRCPVVLVVHNCEAQLLRQRGLPRRLVRLAERLERRALAGADAVIFLAESDCRELVAAYGLRPGRYHVCGVGVDTETFRPPFPAERAAARRALGVDGPVALFAASWHLPNRSAFAAVRNLARTLRDWTFVVVGSVARREEAEDRLRVIGPVEDVLPYFRAADVALNPMSEGSGVNVKVLEYLAAGLPTVTTPFGIRNLDVGDATVVVELEEFAAALARLADPARRASLGAAARRAAESRFSWERVVAAREAVYRELAGSRACACA